MAILSTDLLIGILVGLAVGVAFVVKSNYHVGVRVEQDGETTVIRLNQVVSFLNKPRLRAALRRIADGSRVIFDGRGTEFVDDDILDTIEDFVESAPERGIQVQVWRQEFERVGAAPEVWGTRTEISAAVLRTTGR